VHLYRVALIAIGFDAQPLSLAFSAGVGVRALKNASSPDMVVHLYKFSAIGCGFSVQPLSLAFLASVAPFAFDANNRTTIIVAAFIGYAFDVATRNHICGRPLVANPLVG